MENERENLEKIAKLKAELTRRAAVKCLNVLASFNLSFSEAREALETAETLLFKQPFTVAENPSPPSD